MKIHKNNSYMFLLFKVPLSLVFIILFFELISFYLSDYAAIRHGLDRKVSNLENNIEPYNSDILLFGDSITKDVVDDFKVAYDCCNLLNLSTNRASGLLGSYLLYKKYRKSNKAPKYIMISSTPLFLSFFPKGETKKLYLTSVFDTKEEKKIISSYYQISSKKELSYYPLSWVKKKYQLAIFNLENKIMYPLINAFGLINIKTPLSTGKKDIPPIAVISKMKDVLSKNDKEFNYINSDPLINQEMDKLIEDFFTLLRNDNTSIFIAWAPLKKDYHDSITVNNELIRLEKYLKKKSKKINVNLYLHDFSTQGVFPNNAFRDQDHLKEGYWKTYYAYLLNKYLKSVYVKPN